MAANAAQVLAKEEKKKRKAEGKSGAVKKQKTGKISSKLLAEAHTSDAKMRAGTGKAIFVQPPNLAPDCFLKNYQLKGVRWLASLYENGVSGILADEVRWRCCLWCKRCECLFSHPRVRLRRWVWERRFSVSP